MQLGTYDRLCTPDREDGILCTTSDGVKDGDGNCLAGTCVFNPDSVVSDSGSEEDDSCVDLADGTVCSTLEGDVDDDGTCLAGVCQNDENGRRRRHRHRSLTVLDDMSRHTLGLAPFPRRSLEEEEESEFEKQASKAQQIAVQMKLGTGQGLNGQTAPTTEAGYHHLGATIGIGILVLFNILIVGMLVYQLPHYLNKSRLYL